VRERGGFGTFEESEEDDESDWGWVKAGWVK
jgi:hypothetical protein